MTQKFHVKRGDEVVVIAGAERGKRGKVLALLGKKQRVVVEGVQIVKRHVRKSQQHPNGGIVPREGSVHVSNVMLASRFEEKSARHSSGTDKA